MIPGFVTIDNALWGLLPAGIHLATVDEAEKAFAFNIRRQRLFSGFRRGAEILFKAGCPNLYLDGSFVTEKENPDDYDVLWNPLGVNPNYLEDLLLIETDLKAREKQKDRYFGEYIPASSYEGKSGEPFLSYFQKDKDSKAPKGIVLLENWLKQ